MCTQFPSLNRELGDLSCSSAEGKLSRVPVPGGRETQHTCHHAP